MLKKPSNPFIFTLYQECPKENVSCEISEKLHGYILAEKLDVSVEDAVCKKARLHFNAHENKLYTSVSFITKATAINNEAWVQKIKEEVQKTMNAVTIDTEGDFKVTPDMTVEDMQVSVEEVHAPKGKLWLGSIFLEPETQLRYEEFLQDPRIFLRLKRECINKRIPVPEEAASSVMLPIHVKDAATGEILVSESVYKTFLQYQFYENLMRSDDKSHKELGFLMSLDPKFCEYMFIRTQMLEEGKEIHDDEANFQREIAAAIKRASKKL